VGVLQAKEIAWQGHLVAEFGVVRELTGPTWPKTGLRGL
jgi:hypothetical protein